MRKTVYAMLMIAAALLFADSIIHSATTITNGAAWRMAGSGLSLLIICLCEAYRFAKDSE
ncbi:hypothetical protein JT27_18655 [Alcaligenes faecalis]|nr:hypothetical protein JT27_18655 [Alcaligenes faecalis]